MTGIPGVFRKLDLDAQNDIGESKVIMSEEIQKLKQLVAEKFPELKLPAVEQDTFLEICLRVRKFDLERAAAQVQDFFKFMKNMNAENTFQPSLYQENVYDKLGVTLLKERDNNGHYVLYLDFENMPSDTFHMDSVLAAIMLLKFECLRKFVDVQRHGLVYVCNMAGYDMGHLRQVVTRLRASARMVTEMFPIRVKGMHIVNSSKFYRWTAAILKTFLGEKMGSRFILYDEDLSPLLREIRRDILPNRVGGLRTVEQCANLEFIRNMTKDDEFYKEFFKWGYANTEIVVDDKDKLENVEDLEIIKRAETIDENAEEEDFYSTRM